MKKHSQKLILALLPILIIGLFSACDTVENPVLPRPKTSVIDTAALDRLTNTGYVKKVLLEDYTGHTCGNCPRAAEAADTLKKKYGNNIIEMAVHVGYFAVPADLSLGGDSLYTLDLRSTTGNAYDDFYGVSNQGLPKGIVNRAIPTGKNQAVINWSEWAAAVVEQFAIAPAVGLKLAALYAKDTRVLTFKVQTQILRNLSAPTNLVIYLVEDSLVGAQTDYKHSPDHTRTGYVFNHVLRTSLNGTWGEPLTIFAVPASDKTINRYYSYQIPAEYRARHCRLIAIVTDTQTKTVIQAEEVLVPEN